jgi:hypothetical protein
LYDEPHLPLPPLHVNDELQVPAADTSCLATAALEPKNKPAANVKPDATNVFRKSRRDWSCGSCLSLLPVS